MGQLLLGLLAIGWGAVLIPAGLRRRSERGSFSLFGLGQSLSGLAGLFSRRGSSRNLPGGVMGYGVGAVARGPVAPIQLPWAQQPAGRPGQRPAQRTAQRPGQRRSGPSRNVRRQRSVVVGLLVVAVITLLLSFVPGLRVLLAVHFAADVLLALYVMALLRLKQPASAPTMRNPSRQRSSSIDSWTDNDVDWSSHRRVG